MKHSVNRSISVSLKLDRGEWVLRAGGWSVATISFTVQINSDGQWITQIDSTGFRAYERRWTIKDRAVFSAGYRFPGFFPRREDLPASVVTELYSAYMESHAFPEVLPPITAGGLSWEKKA